MSITETKKRVFIQIEVTPEQKEEFTKTAINKHGLNASDYGRLKLFAPDAVEKAEEIVTGTDPKDLDTALSRIRELMKTVKEQSETIQELTAITNGKNEEGLKPVTESDFLINLTPTKRAIIDKSIELEGKRFFGEDYKHLKHFLFKKLGDIVGSNSDELPEVFLTKGSLENNELKELIEMLKGGAQ